MSEGRILIDIIARDEASAAIERAAAKIRALSAAQEDNLRRMGAYAGGIFNARAMSEAESQLGLAVSEVGHLNSEIERSAAIGRLIPEDFKIAAASASAFEAELERVARTHRGLLDQFGRRVTTTSAADIGGMAPGFAGRVATGAAVSRAENISQERVYKQQIQETTQALNTYYNEQQRVASAESRFAAGAAPRSNVAAQRRVEADAQRSQMSFERDLFDMETAGYARTAAAQRTAYTEMSARLKSYFAEQSALAAAQDRFAARAAPRTAVRFDPGLGQYISGVKEAEQATSAWSRVMPHMISEVDELTAGRRRQAISTLGAAMRSLGLSGPMVAAAFATIGTVVIGAELAGVAEKMGKLALQTQNAAAATGMSVGQFSLLQRQMQLMDGNAESAIRLFGFLGTAVDQALTDPMSKARGAFDELGIGLDQLRDAAEHPINLLELLRQKFQSMDEAQRKLIFGRNFEALIPYLRMTQEEFERTKRIAEESGSVIGDEIADKLDKTKEASNRLSEAFTGLGIAIAQATTQSGFLDWLSNATEGMTRLIDKLNSPIPPGLLPYGGVGQGPPAPSYMPGSRQGEMPTGVSDFWNWLSKLGAGGAAPYGGVGQGGPVIPFTQSGRAEGSSGQADVVAHVLSLVKTLEGYAPGAVSAKGAIGQYQITPDTARTYGFDPSQLKDAAYNQTVAAAIVSHLLDQFKGSVQDVLIAYNAGPGAVAKFHQTGQLPDETRKYLARAGMPGDTMAPPNWATGTPPTGMTFAAARAPNFDPQQLQKELDANVKVITEETQLYEAGARKKIAAADKDQVAINAIDKDRIAFVEQQAKRELTIRKEYADRAAQFSIRAGKTPDPEIQSHLRGGASPQTAVLAAQTQEIETQNNIRTQQLQAQKELLQGELALAKAPAAQLEIKNKIAQIDFQLATSLKAQSILQLELTKNAQEYRDAIDASHRKVLEMQDTVGQHTAHSEQVQMQIQQLTAPAGASPSALASRDAAITAQMASESEKRWQAEADASQKGSTAWIEAEDKIAETAAAATDKMTEDLRKIAEETKKTAAQFTQAFTGAFDVVGSGLHSMVNTDIKDLITGWPLATQQIRYFEATSASGLPIVEERVRQVGVAVQQLQKLETSAAQAGADLVLKLGDMIAAKGLGALLGVSTGAGTEAGSSIAGVLGAKITSLIPGLGSQLPAAAAPITQAIGSQAGVLSSATGALSSTTGGALSATAISTPIVTAVGANATATSTALTALGTSINTVAGINTTAITTAISALTGVTTAGVVKPSVLGTTFQYGGIVSAQGGMMVGRGAQMAVLHTDEMVLPRHLSLGVQNAIEGGTFGGGGPASMDAYHFHVHAMDTQTGAQFLMRHASTIVRAASKGARNNAMTQRTF